MFPVVTSKSFVGKIKFGLLKNSKEGRNIFSGHWFLKGKAGSTNKQFRTLKSWCSGKLNITGRDHKKICEAKFLLCAFYHIVKSFSTFSLNVGTVASFIEVIKRVKYCALNIYPGFCVHDFLFTLNDIHESLLCIFMASTTSLSSWLPAT